MRLNKYFHNLFSLSIKLYKINMLNNFKSFIRYNNIVENINIILKSYNTLASKCCYILLKEDKKIAFFFIF
jgi:flagellar biosynthesis protein FlhB